eukprot:6173137-Pleurochrysis_carterae.AAC.1
MAHTRTRAHAHTRTWRTRSKRACTRKPCVPASPSQMNAHQHARECMHATGNLGYGNPIYT